MPEWSAGLKKNEIVMYNGVTDRATFWYNISKKSTKFLLATNNKIPVRRTEWQGKQIKEWSYTWSTTQKLFVESEPEIRDYLNL
jgi:hypothetical protein